MNSVHKATDAIAWRFKTLTLRTKSTIPEITTHPQTVLGTLTLKGALTFVVLDFIYIAELKLLEPLSRYSTTKLPRRLAYSEYYGPYIRHTITQKND